MQPVRRKKLKNQFSLQKLSSITKGMDSLDFYTDHPYADWYMTMVDKGHSQQFSKRIGFWTWWSILRMPLHTNMLCKRLIVYEWLDQKWLGIHFLFLSKNHKPCFEISVANFFRLITPQTHAGHSRCLASWNFDCVWVADPNFSEANS